MDVCKCPRGVTVRMAGTTESRGVKAECRGQNDIPQRRYSTSSVLRNSPNRFAGEVPRVFGVKAIVICLLRRLSLLFLPSFFLHSPDQQWAPNALLRAIHVPSHQSTQSNSRSSKRSKRITSASSSSSISINSENSFRTMRSEGASSKKFLSFGLPLSPTTPNSLYNGSHIPRMLRP